MNKQLDELLKDKRFKDSVLSDDNIEWLCPTGSISLDIFLEGGIRPGYFRVSGEMESGKTSFALNIGRQFQIHIPNAFVVVINAEGRITPTVEKRIGIDTNPSKYKRIDTNIYETGFQIMRELILNNPENYRYLFIIDSLDSLNRKEDYEKSFSDAEKVAGGALINSVMGKRTSLPLIKYGHACIALSQTRTAMNTSGYGNTGPKTTVSGGKAPSFYSSMIAEIRPLWTDLYIWENPNAAKIADKGKRLGHYCIMSFKKTGLEKSGQEVSIPIKYGAAPGEAIWRSIELIDLALQWDLLKKGGAWYEFDAAFAKELGDKFEKKHQGYQNLLKYLEENKEFVEKGLDKFRKLTNAPV